MFQALKATHGKEVANAIMEMLPPAGVPELSTKADLSLLRADVELLRSDLMGEINSVRSDLMGEINSVRSELTAEIVGVRSEVHLLRAEVGEAIQRAMREQTSRFLSWMFGALGFGLAAAATVSGLG